MSEPVFPQPSAKRTQPTLAQILSLPPQLLSMYDEFITQNAGQVSQIESALRSLTYVIPGSFFVARFDQDNCSILTRSGPI